MLSESYLYTTNGVESDLQHLSPGGIFVAQFGEVDDTYYLRTTRFVATARQALANLGIRDPADHIMVAVHPDPLPGHHPALHDHRVRAAGSPRPKSGRFRSAVKGGTGDDRPTTAAAHTASATRSTRTCARRTPSSGLLRHFPFDVTPTTDNDPFFYHFARYGTVLSHYTHR